NTTLQDIAQTIGYGAIVGDDDLYVSEDQRAWLRVGIEPSGLRAFGTGESFRDWSTRDIPSCIYPYDDYGRFRIVESAERHFWLYRTCLKATLFYAQTKEQRGLNWREYAIIVKDKLFRRESLLFAFVATHNHFVFDRIGNVSNKSAPGVKLKLEADINDHI